ncbi:monothiol glutaredoxin-5 [Ophiostoma piceae UAMH 11346]|uniref:Monothiol glutaredoxin-5, mitochondrial n=1 Tax=Ophiostoma piceae (strain UAMH 11346) TaxID=1262450 RepID=S3C341_OPHP1|nr:monothiol glutaredoxin-5 [Ophiostoma piceae UAMH 11346]
MLARTSRQLLRRPASAASVPSVAVAARFSTAIPTPRRPTVNLQPLQKVASPSAIQSVQSATATFGQRRFIADHTREAIDRAVHSAPVVLFMKGTPELPQCGFSRASIQVLGLQGVDPEKFAAFNVLEDAELRAGVKEYSDWPTIPQLYVDSEFVGGCDILIAMHQSGELAKLFEEKKVLIAAGEGDAEAEPEKKE